MSGTYDPEGDDMECWIGASYEEDASIPPNPANGCPLELNRSFPGAPSTFSVTVYASDGNNPASTWTFDVELYNQIPEASMTISRTGQLSSDTVIINGSSTLDPEGDPVKFQFMSDIDGTFHSGVSSDGIIEWTGTLSKGTHTITMQASDDRPAHAGQWTTYSTQVQVNNSLPMSVISSPMDGHLTDSGTLVTLASTGSGDWDISCSDLPENGSGLICNPSKSISSDLVSVLWRAISSKSPWEAIGTWRLGCPRAFTKSH